MPGRRVRDHRPAGTPVHPEWYSDEFGRLLRRAGLRPITLHDGPDGWRAASVRGSVMVGGQKIQVGLPHARKTVAVTVGPDTYQVAGEPGITITITAPRTASRDIRRREASSYG